MKKMIHASFDDRSHKSAAIAGIYQYDTGQRLKMHGLPSPQELAERDDFLSGDAVTVQAQYGFVGDSQTETRMASYDEGSGCWTADIPDIYLTRSSTVKVFVYVGYGAAEGAGRSKTCYEGSFTPVSRPAPGTQVTPEQTNAWDALVAEVNLTLAKMNTAVSGANAAAETAGTAAKAADKAAGSAESAAKTAGDAAGSANSAAEAVNQAAKAANTAAAGANTAAAGANTQAAHLQSMVVQAETREYGSGSTASLTDDGEKKILSLGLERGMPGRDGAKGERGEKGEKGDTGTAGVTFQLVGTVLTITTV